LPGAIGRIGDERIASVIERIEARPNHRHTCSQLAATVNLSPSRLRHLFRQTTGVSISTFINQQRHIYATALLRDPNLSIKEIMLSLGFAHSSNFDRWFRKEHGCSPSEYRRAPENSQNG
jgi:AraC family transcriptional regulator, arabinose operon regulatory protein